MRQTTTVKIPAQTEERVVAILCDFCGRDVRTSGHAAQSSFAIEAVTIARTYGMAYPDSGWENKRSVDMCGTCFEDKLVPWIQAQGVQVRTAQMYAR